MSRPTLTRAACMGAGVGVVSAVLGITLGSDLASSLVISFITGTILWFAAMVLFTRGRIDIDSNRLSPWLEAEAARCASPLARALMDLGPLRPGTGTRTACAHARAVTLYRYGHGITGRSCPDCGQMVDVPGACRHADAVPVEAGGETVAWLCPGCGEQLAHDFRPNPTEGA